MTLYVKRHLKITYCDKSLEVSSEETFFQTQAVQNSTFKSNQTHHNFCSQQNFSAGQLLIRN